MWDPTAYLRYGDERSRPFFDLLARVGAEQPREVVDLGCGPGQLTASLALRWPDAGITGVDSSPEMIDRALSLASPITFTVGDVRDWLPSARADVVVSNATLHWVPEHPDLLVRWAAAMPTGGWLGVQVPGNFDAPSHRSLRAVGDDPRWREEITPLLREAPVLDPTGYAALLRGAGCDVDAWETTYVHVLRVSDAADHPVLSWMEGTALRPVRAALGQGPSWTAFRAALTERLASAYPVRDGEVLFPFRRVFFVARTGARPARRDAPTQGEP
jgi:trans-aconitate 2-methyltransferase